VRRPPARRAPPPAPRRARLGRDADVVGGAPPRGVRAGAPRGRRRGGGGAQPPERRSDAERRGSGRHRAAGGGGAAGRRTAARPRRGGGSGVRFVPGTRRSLGPPRGALTPAASSFRFALFVDTARGPTPWHSTPP